MGGEESTAPAEVAFQAAIANEIGEPVERATRLEYHRPRVILAVTPAEFGIPGFDFAADLATVARAATRTDGSRVDHQGGLAGSGGLQRAVQTGVTGADDEHIHRFRR